MQIKSISNSNKLLTHLHIYNENLSVKIFLNLGASLQQLRFNDIEVIDGISSDQSGLDDYKATYKSSVLFPFPNRIEDGKYEYKGKKHQLEVNETPLNNALHGLVYNKEFKVIESTTDREKAEIKLQYISDGNLPGYPFPFELNLLYSIHHSGSISQNFEVINTGDVSMPFGLGWHPYFKSDNLNKSRLSFSSKDHFICNNRNLPINNKNSVLEKDFKLETRNFDDAWSLNQAVCELEEDNYVVSMNFEFNGDPYLQIYTPEHRRSIAIEPMTCVANSFNNKIGFNELSSGQSSNWSIDMRITSK